MLARNSNNLTSQKPRSARIVTLAPSGSSASRRDKHKSSKSLRWFFTSSLSTVSQSSGVALPWRVTRRGASVDWLSTLIPSLPKLIPSSPKDEISPVHRHDDLASRPRRLAKPGAEQVPGDHARVAQQPVDLLDRGLGQQSPRRGERPPDHRNRERAPGHDPERSVGQGKHALGAQVVDQYAVQKIMNEIKLLLRRPHESPSPLILRRTARRVSNSGFFESQKMRDS
jgi:hypothetical protein